MYDNSRPSLIPNQPDPGYQTLHVLMGSHTPCIHGFHLSKPNFDQTSSLELMLLTMFGINWNSHSKLQSYTFDSQQKKCSAGTQRLSSPFSSASVTIHRKTRKQFNASPLYNSAMRSSYCLPSLFWTTHVRSECHHMARCYLCDYTSLWAPYDTSPDPWKTWMMHSLTSHMMTLSNWSSVPTGITSQPQPRNQPRTLPRKTTQPSWISLLSS